MSPRAPPSAMSTRCRGTARRDAPGPVSPGDARPLSFRVGSGPAVSGLLVRPRGALCVFVLAHGAGAGMRHPFMETMADLLAARAMATFRYQFPYLERGGRRPDSPALLQETVRAATREARRACRGLPMIAGGKSMGGRMTSLAAADGGLDDVLALVFLGFPLHPAGRPSATRGAHLDRVRLPMLFVQGERDRLASPDRIESLCGGLDRVTLHMIRDADHSFHVPRRSGRDDAAVLEEVAATVASWSRRRCGRKPGTGDP